MSVQDWALTIAATWSMKIPLSQEAKEELRLEAQNSSFRSALVKELSEYGLTEELMLYRLIEPNSAASSSQIYHQ